MIYDKLLVFFVGSCVGSFLNVCIHRLPKELSIIRPRSFCPQCKTTIRWYDNMPIVSFFLLRAKCRSCKAPISGRYPLVEALTALVFLFFYCKYGISFDFFRFIFFFSMLIAVSFIDIDYHAIPGYLCFLGITAGLLFSVYETIQLFRAGYPGRLPIVNAFGGMVFGLGFTYFFKYFGDILLGVYLSLIKKESIEGETEALGLGDVDFMGMVGVFLGARLVITTFFVAPFIAALYSIIALIFKKSHLIPYLPYLSAATLVSYLWGDVILLKLGFM